MICSSDTGKTLWGDAVAFAQVMGLSKFARIFVQDAKPSF